MCTYSDSSEEHLGSFQIWDLLKYAKRRWCLPGHTGDSNLTSGRPQLGWWHCVPHALSTYCGAGPLPPAPWGCDPGQVWYSAEALWLCSSQRAPVWSGCSAWCDKEIISIFTPFCLTFFTGVKCVADSFMKREKNTLNWSYILADPTSRCPYQVLWWISCKTWKTKNLSLFFRARKLVPSFNPFVVELSFSEIIESCIFDTKALRLLLSRCALLSSQDVVVLFGRVLRLHGRVLVAGRATGFCEKLLKASPGPAEPLPGGSKMDVFLVKAWPVGNGGNPSGITYLRRKKKKKVTEKM